jgi:hypothetical protein
MAPSTHLSLLRTCRQINSEAKYLPLALGTLSVDHLSTLGMLILRRILCEGQRHTVSSLTFVLRPYVRVLDLAYDRNADHYIRPSTQYLIDKWTSALSTFSGLPMLPEARKLYIQLDKQGMDISADQDMHEIKVGGRRNSRMEETWDRFRKDLLRQRPGLEITSELL